MDNIRIDRHGHEEDLSHYTAEQLAVIMEDRRRSANVKTGARTLIVLGLIVVGVIIAIPLIARLYSWGFGG